ncbi:hypothetical protein A2W13_01990 [Candidatus Woesebacteria bacterium RBG_16_36_11]|uniref:DUF8173 domain-containing protein n=1 Tax=Candidatus Woesebacteria bacterium RBG_16_36_11 TaxID=1802481 RepID=A0A1F7XBJ5_9BACT|nr:MAG: hypothetical protein A2W13_01990 [Candidatus Woesebacteria bacterium RBG_16_36_11]
MRKIITSLLILLFAFFVFSVTSVSAKVISDEKGSVNVGKTEIINDDLFIGAETAEVAGTVNGDVFVGAQTVKISGIINGNLHVGANTFDLRGTVKGNVYAGAQNVLVSSSTIGGSLLIGAATVNIDRDSSIGGSILAGAGGLTIDSQVKRSVYAGTGNLTIGSDAIIGKDLYYSSGQEQANISSSAKIAGSIYKSEVAKSPSNIEGAKKLVPTAINGAKVFSSFIAFIGALIVGLLYLKLFAKYFTQTASIVSKSFWKSMGIGFLVTIALIPGMIILLITVIGIPLAGLAFLVFLLYSYLAKIIVGLTFGDLISKQLKWKMTTFWSFALGLLVIDILRFIPKVGFLVTLVVLWIGLGALTLRMFSKSN